MLLMLRTLAQDDVGVADEILTDAAESGDEELAETAEMDCEYIESITDYKIDINTLNVSELQSLPIFNAIQINDIMEYRSRYGDIVSFGELKAIPSLTPDIIRRLSNYVSVADSTTNRRQYTVREMFTKGRHYVFRNT